MPPKKNTETQSMPDFEPLSMADIESMSPAEMQAAILRVELQTKMLGLNEAARKNKEFVENERNRHESNRRRQAEMAEQARNQAGTEQQCRHQSGGKPDNILKGGGIGSFSIISRAIMPDGVTVLLQCARCGMKRYPPTDALKKEDPRKYLAELTEYNKLLDDAVATDMEPLRGPTFVFKNAEGVPIIPERV